MQGIVSLSPTWKYVFSFCFVKELALASEQLVELEKFKHEVEIKLKEHQNVEQQKTDLERHVQTLIKVTY